LAAISLPLIENEQRAVERSAHANELLVLRHADLVRSIAYQMMRRMPPNLDVEDLIQTGMVGLLEAAQRYEGRMGATFETFALPRIRGAMLDWCRRSDWSSRSMRRRLRDIEQARLRIETNTGEAASAPALAAASGMTLEIYHRVVRDFSLSIQLSLDERGPLDEANICAEPVDDSAGPAEELEREQIFQALRTAIDLLPEDERAIFFLYYSGELLMREIGVLLGISESRISQIHKKTIGRLRAATQM
jgi:RNA polymerase sigma factor for flagellar operon FliA